QPGFVSESFSTIAGYEANAALPHYSATPESHSELHAKGMLLIDSGAQYLGGTTDITRMWALGETTPEQRRDVTLVLKGVIALSSTKFPRGASGQQLDALARAPIWAAGVDYDHGTGHGVGSYLGVHEGPQRISKLPNAQALLPGMIVSDEPGYYKTGAYGIRIENLVAVMVVDGAAANGKAMLGFETLTLAPFDRALIEPALLDPAETAWIDAYHARIRAELASLLDKETAGWFEAATQPLSSA
ncbi:MAG: M24B family metallopeptidase, partial [Stellaceae bacterium]